MKKVLLLVFGILFVSSVSASDVAIHGTAEYSAATWVVIDKDIYYCFRKIPGDSIESVTATCVKAKKTVSN